MFTAAGFSTALAHALASGGIDVGASRPPRLCIALSGGLDSTVLLTALAELRRKPSPWREVTWRAVHVDHGLHPDSSRWAHHCAGLAATHDVPFEAVELALRPARGESVEAAARTARYEALAARLAPGDVLLTAHHADDQLETILLQWLRGGGLRAVAGMERMARFGGSGAWLARPLLDFTRADLRGWAVAHALDWLEDPANDAQRFDRNYLRREVVPRLRQRWPAVAHTAARVAEFAREALALEASGAAIDLERLRRGRALHLDSLSDLTVPRQRAALRSWVHELGLPVPAAGTLEALRRDMANAANDRIPEVRWAGAVVRRYRGCLHAEPGDHDRAPCPTVLEFESSLLENNLRTVQHDDRAGCQDFEWIGGSRLEFTAAAGTGLSRERLPTHLLVRQRAGGERFQPAGSAHRRELRKWLQEHDVLPWRRADVPLLFDARNRELIAVADLACAEAFAARPGEPSWRITWRDRGALTESDVVGSNWRDDPSFR